ncbi:MAG: DUF4124 domain-containing protein [Candidatus Thiodiazotropha sp. (ex. Lucinisca nassula)]|nr:DUF4124 domain-containing protein [Candidatus Thiodiazotropha sp. (ex. Lucinisca nassula)]MBW9272203.1 DUF4124 domain-containing protein [Candidatus Thiodiazotropha sp. (ex. Lucinisca nassula)]PUB81001.1 MAG: hypothetical protein DBP01_16845 [gamma proteobacterium symbiont of Ctena orbiculata]PUB85806.1 MAG: hypothetical protein DBP02_04840 [gamma proteobacterium symbiont of Ctena orbiculata]
MRIVVLLMILLMALPLFARDVYKYISEDGEVIYSERYHPDAERIKVTDSKKTTALPPDEQSDEARAAAGEYATFSIVQPNDDETIRNEDGSVPVGITLSPDLAEGHVIHLYVDGTKLESDIKQTQLILQQLSRGTHSLQAKIVTSEGESLKESNSITFHLRQPAVN